MVLKGLRVMTDCYKCYYHFTHLFAVTWCVTIFFSHVLFNLLHLIIQADINYSHTHTHTHTHTARSVVVSTLNSQSRGPGLNHGKRRGKWSSLLMCGPSSPSSK
ncbi:hypothetical protein E2C01_022070 [Portunus trituberculatus]|uniref:Uncharacterized protein n=1 Tax=Portunus trituberculatus TaxID=210409 RepID=A0A5B7E692_PORTR|nr:hypothetical protein [Portunus trituberculatus]